MVALASVATWAMLQFAAAGPVDDDAPPPPPLVDHRPQVHLVDPYVEQLLDCLAWHESRNNPRAYNRSSGASGLLQFLPSTYAGTPPGRAGRSIWDAAAQLEAGRWMIAQGRKREWVPVQRGLCR